MEVLIKIKNSRTKEELNQKGISGTRTSKNWSIGSKTRPRKLALSTKGGQKNTAKSKSKKTRTERLFVNYKSRRKWTNSRKDHR
jgi:hypothetical protein